MPAGTFGMQMLTFEYHRSFCKGLIRTEGILNFRGHFQLSSIVPSMACPPSVALDHWRAVIRNVQVVGFSTHTIFIRSLLTHLHSVYMGMTYRPSTEGVLQNLVQLKDCCSHQSLILPFTLPLTEPNHMQRRAREVVAHSSYAHRNLTPTNRRYSR